ncbi:MAG: GTPase [Clostridia bacterium]|nr:GTPase [Clostridia bacterium]
MPIPVYLFTGFLESGKTKFVQETFEDPRFEDGLRALLLVCEEGEEEYEPSRFAVKNCRVEYISSEEELTRARLEQITADFRPEKIVIECNGMWPLGRLYEALPKDWAVYQQMLFFDGSTFAAYNANLRSLVYDKLWDCDMAVFNRVPRGTDLMEYHRIVRAVSRSCDIAYEYPDGEVQYDDIEDPLPFDLSAPVVEIDDKDYAIWYRDMTEEMEKYDGKTVSLTVTVAREQKGKRELIIGRHVMTCCADDITFAGLVCCGDFPVGLRARDWVKLTARIRLEDSPVYKRRGPVLYAESAILCDAPEEPVATFY